MKNKTCLFLGYNSKKTKLIDFLKSKKIIVTQHQNKILSKKLIRKYDFIISFGYRKIIPIKIIIFKKTDYKFTYFLFTI